MIDTSKLNVHQLTTATSDASTPHPLPVPNQLWIANTGYRRNARRRIVQVLEVSAGYVHVLSWWEEHTPHIHTNATTPITDCVDTCAWLRVGSTGRQSRILRSTFTVRRSSGYTLLSDANSLSPARVKASQSPVNDTAAAMLAIMRKTGPVTGHDIMTIFSNTLGDFWTLTRSQVYRELTTLSESGYVTRTTPGSRKRQPYEITPLGRGVAREWLLTPPDLDTPRNAFALQLTLTNTERDATMLHHIREALIRTHTEVLKKLYVKLTDARHKSAHVGTHVPHPDSLQFAIYYHEMVIRWASNIRLGDTTSAVNLTEVTLADDSETADVYEDVSVSTGHATDAYLIADDSDELTNLRDHASRCVCSAPSLPKITTSVERSLPPSMLAAAVNGAAELDPHAFSLNGRNFLAHALRKLLSEDWINPAKLTSVEDASFGCDK